MGSVQILKCFWRKNQNVYGLEKTFTFTKNGTFLRIFEQVGLLIQKNWPYKNDKQIDKQWKSVKLYCSLLKTLLVNNNVPSVFPSFYNTYFIIDFKEKSKLFNSFFVEHCYFVDKWTWVSCYVKLYY